MMNFVELEQILDQVREAREQLFELAANGIELPPLDHTVISLLEEMTGNTGWISVWANELDFTGGTVHTENGDVEITTVDDIFNLMTVHN